VGAVIVFIWSSISWTVLPWHNWDMKSFTDDGVAITQALQSQAPESGLYSIPNTNFKIHHATPEQEKAWHEKALQGPFAFISVNNKGLRWDMKTALGVQFLATFIVAFIVVGFLKQTRLLHTFAKALFIMFALLSGSFLMGVAHWNWWAFPTTAMWVNLADVAISWFFAGLVMAKVVRK
jgi:hypothetical protein